MSWHMKCYIWWESASVMFMSIVYVMQAKVKPKLFQKMILCTSLLDILWLTNFKMALILSVMTFFSPSNVTELLGGWFCKAFIAIKHLCSALEKECNHLWLPWPLKIQQWWWGSQRCWTYPMGWLLLFTSWKSRIVG